MLVNGREYTVVRSELIKQNDKMYGKGARVNLILEYDGCTYTGYVMDNGKFGEIVKEGGMIPHYKSETCPG